MGDVFTQAQDGNGQWGHREGAQRSLRHVRQPARYPSRGAFAALDLGTNNCRLLIARPEGDRFAVLDAFSRIVRLGEGLTTSGRLSDAAMDRAVSALSVCADKLMRRNVLLAHSVATEACRRAANGAEFVERVYRQTGIILDIISSRDEARLAVLGCHQLLEPGDGPALIFDIGGGSTEIVHVELRDGVPHMRDWMSVPWGVVSLTEAVPHDADDPIEREKAYAKMLGCVSDAFNQFAARALSPGGGTPRLLGTSGTVTTLGSVHLDLPYYDRRKIDGLHVASDDLRAICRHLAEIPIAGRAEYPCIGEERADLVVSGCAILDALLDAWPAPRVGIADRGIREGILRQLMSGWRA